MKPLLPTLKEKKRYLLFEISSDSSVNKELCADTIHNACLQLLGELGCARAGIIFLGESYKNNKGILRVATKYVDDVVTALATIKIIADEAAEIHIKKVSGNISKLKPLIK